MTDILPGISEETARQWYAERNPVFRGFLDKTEDIIRSTLDIATISVVNVTPRVKTQDSFMAKLARKSDKYKRLEDCQDIAGCRVVCLTKLQVAEVVSALGPEFNVIEDELRKSKKTEFGYETHHLLVEWDAVRLGHPEYARYAGLKCEIQVRTAFQEAWAALDHKVKYKPDSPPSPEVLHRISRIAALVELADEEWVSIYRGLQGDTNV